MMVDVPGRRVKVGETVDLRSIEDPGFLIMEDGTPVGLDG